MIKRKDFMDYEVVLALYTICHSMDCIIDEIAECDLPEVLRDDYRAVKSSICALTESIAQYRDETGEILLASCDE